MKTIFTLLCCLTFSFFNSYAQQAPGYKYQIDSVQTLLNKISKSDTLRVIELNRLARLCIYDLQYDRGLTAATEARALAKAIDYPQGEGMYLRTLDNLVYHGWASMEPYRVLTFWSFKDLKKAEYPINFQYSDQIDQTKRVAALAIASKTLEKKGNMDMAAYVYQLLAQNYLEEKNIEKAIESIEKAEHIFIQLRLDLPLIESIILKTKILKAAGKDSEVRKEELEMVRISEIHKDDRERALLYGLIAEYYFWNTQQTDISLDYSLKSIQILENLGEKYFLAEEYFWAGAAFYLLEFPQKSVEYFAKSFDLIISGKINDSWLGSFYLFYPQRLIEVGEFKKAEEINAIGKSASTDESSQLRFQGLLLMAKGQYKESIEKFYNYNVLDGVKRGKTGNDEWVNNNIAFCLSRLGKLQESNHFAIKAYQMSIKIVNRKSEVKKACLILYENYEKLGQLGKALEYLKIYTEWVKKDKQQDIANRAAKMEIQTVIDKSEQEKEILEQEKILQEKANQNQRWWLFSIAAGLLSSLLVLFLLMKNNRNKQKANKLLEQQKEEINTQKNKAEEALITLKSTQSQLIQSEKMASLGELTAGIAHEIQNPLNFVNNFSEVSIDLIEEMKEELANGNDEEVNAITEDLKQNLEKINHHGNRASSIVKGMLQHSRTSTGQKELTDINALADEYLRLSYHGLRAKDKSFNAGFKTDFDENLPKINVIPQDIGRVLLNLINNAFYAVDKKAKSFDPLTPKGGIEERGKDYKPTVTISTASFIPPSGASPDLSGGPRGVKITVTDNGPGIPSEIKDKIFQPFFTTKPTGQGTGLGLSLAYDIVKAHGGNIRVESPETGGSEFIIEIPLKS